MNPTSEPKRRVAVADFFIRLWNEKPLGTACGIVILILILVGIFADVLAPYHYDEYKVVDRLQGSSARYPLGTDQVGRDYMSLIIYGARISLLVGLATTTLSVVLSSLIGGISGFLGGKLDIMLQRFTDAWNSFPGLILLLTVMSIVGQGVVQIILVLGISGGLGGSRVIRGWVMSMKENVYFEAAEAAGSSKWRTFLRHGVPSVMPIVIISFSMSVGGTILSISSLSFLGYGMPVEIPEWGGLLSVTGRRFMEQAPHLAFWPGLFLTITIYCLNMFGDAVRDLLDPRLKGGAGHPGFYGAKSLEKARKKTGGKVVPEVRRVRL